MLSKDDNQRTRRSALMVAGVTASLAILPGQANAAVRSANLVFKKADQVTLGPSETAYAITADDVAVTQTNKPGYLVSLAGTLETVLLVDGAVYWRSSDYGEAFNSIDDQVAVEDGGKYAMILTNDQANATGDSETKYVLTHDGKSVAQGDPAPYVGATALYTDFELPRVDTAGNTWVFADIDKDGGQYGDRVALLKIDDAGTAATKVLASGDPITGSLLNIYDGSFGLTHDFSISRNGAHYIIEADTTAGSTEDAAVLLDGAIVLQELQPINAGENFDNFDHLGVNNVGNWVVSGDSDGAASKDEYVVYNGNLIAQEGGTYGGLTLGSSASVYAVAINDDNHVLHHWDTDSGEHLLVTCDPNYADDRTTLVLSEGDEIDVDNDTIPDYTIDELLVDSYNDVTQQLANGNSVFAQVTLEDANASTFTAIVEIPYGCCGNGMQEGAEECDDGNAIDDDGCTNACTSAVCGDGILQTGESCDDGNANDQDGCTNACTVAACGDGIVQNGVEECDDANSDDTDMCTNACTVAMCGDGVVQTGVEECDDANSTDDDTCTNACTAPVCGDGIVQAGEGCDDGNLDDTDACTTKCALPSCGDGLNQPGEECDDGNTSDTDDCSNQCTLPVCGDGITQMGEGEQCDDQNIVNDDACSNLCRDARCGDGIVQTDEACDDGNLVNDDDCTNACEAPACGDGIVQGGEECDDGNDVVDDACKPDCIAAYCGDGIIQTTLGEECDDDNAMDGDGCSAVCRLEDSGDGDGDGDGGMTGGMDDDGGMTDGMDTDGMNGNGASDDGGCSVTADTNEKTGALAGLLGLGLVAGLGRRRRKAKQTA